MSEDAKGIFGPNWLAGGLAVATIVGAWVYTPTLLNRIFGYSDFSCAGLVSDVITTSKENARGLISIHIVDIVEVATLSTGDDETSCEGLALLSNTARQRVKYRAYREFDKWWVEYDLAM